MTPYLLLVEDDEASAYLTLKALAINFFPAKIVRVKDGKEALMYLKEIIYKPTLVLLDIKLPKVSGIDVLGAMRESCALKSISVIMLTASNMEKDREDAFELGIVDYIVKPIDFSELVAKMGEVTSVFDIVDKKRNALASAIGCSEVQRTNCAQG